MFRVIKIVLENQEIISTHKSEDLALRAADRYKREFDKLNGQHNLVGFSVEEWLDNRVLDCTMGVYDTCIKLLTKHKNGDITIQLPIVRGENNNGVLNFVKIRMPFGENTKILKRCFRYKTLYDKKEQVDLWDLI